MDLATFPQKYIPYPRMKGAAHSDRAAGSSVYLVKLLKSQWFEVYFF